MHAHCGNKGKEIGRVRTFHCYGISFSFTNFSDDLQTDGYKNSSINHYEAMLHVEWHLNPH
jgi:hypothetical protein